MNTKTSSSRRSFIRRAGAALATPLAAGAASAAAASTARGNDALEARLAALNDTDAIRKLNQTYARLVNARAYDDLAALFADPAQASVDANLRRLSSESFGDRDAIEIAADGRSATAHIHCTVETERPIEPGCTLVDMARQQGEGVVRRTERRVIENTYEKHDVWKLVRSTHRSA